VNDATFTLTFKGNLPKLLAHGETVRVTGHAVVTSIASEVIDISSPERNQYALGYATVELVGVDLGIERS